VNAINPSRLKPASRGKAAAEEANVHLSMEPEEQAETAAAADPAALPVDPPHQPSAPPSAHPSAEQPRKTDNSADNSTEKAGKAGKAGPTPQRSGAAANGAANAASNAAANAAGIPAQLAAIEVLLSVEVGCHRLPLRDLLGVEAGQLFTLDRMTSEPVTVLVNGRPFASGEIVAIGERFGVRLLDILPGDD